MIRCSSSTCRIKYIKILFLFGKVHQDYSEEGGRGGAPCFFYCFDGVKSVNPIKFSSEASLDRTKFFDKDIGLRRREKKVFNLKTHRVNFLLKEKKIGEYDAWCRHVYPAFHGFYISANNISSCSRATYTITFIVSTTWPLNHEWTRTQGSARKQRHYASIARPSFSVKLTYIKF